MTEQPPGNYPPPPPPGNYPPPPGGGGYQPAGGQPPDNNLVWAILSIFCCWPLAIVAIIKSTQVSGLWSQGRYDEAQKAADDAKKFALWGAIAGVVLGVLYIIFIFALGGLGAMSSY